MELAFAQQPWPSAPCGFVPGMGLGSQLRVHRVGDPYRPQVERFIHGVYQRRYGADIQSFAPVLVSLCDETGILAAAGYRDATEGPLFLEHYLDQPVETLLTSLREGSTTREGIAEVGHLSAHRAGEGRKLIMRLGPHLAEHGFSWVVTTVTEELLHLFNRIGLTPLMLGIADPRALGSMAHLWGSYYDHHPSVVCGQLKLALQQMARRMALSGSNP